jgi:pimeloyl-ACP methyl ester carboxylesterase
MRRDEWLRAGHTTTLNRERIWFRVDGHGPTLLFGHGYPTSSHDWAAIITRLRARYRCVSFDFLGFGASSKPRTQYTYALQHQVLERVAAVAQVSRALLVVHDYAVTIGQDFLAEARVPRFSLDGVVFLNGAIDPAQHRARPIQRFLASRIGKVVGPLLVRRRAVMRALDEVVVRCDRLCRDDIWASITDDNGVRTLPHLLHYIAERRLRRDELVASLGKARVPIGFAWGMDDPVSGRHVLDAVRTLVPSAPVRELAGVGHYPQLEAPDEVAAFIDEMASRARTVTT